MDARRALSFYAALFVFSGALSANASPSFPNVIQTELMTKDPPACTTCHSTPSGGLGTATTAFATYLRSRGLKASDQGSLRAALQAMIGEKHDTDMDGMLDVDELKAGTDPNGVTDTSRAPVEYGCGAQVAPRARFADPAGGWILLALVVLTWRLRVRHVANPRADVGEDRP